jgi:hypothetical protein
MDLHLINIETGESQNTLYCFIDHLSMHDITAIIGEIGRTIPCEPIIILGEQVILN